MAAREDRRRKTLARLVRLRELETINAARKSADLVTSQARLTSLSKRSASVIADQSAKRGQSTAAELRQEFRFTHHLSELRATSLVQAKELEPQIAAATQTHGQSKHREDRLKDLLNDLARRIELRANHRMAAQSGEMARKLKRDFRSGGLTGASGE